MGRVVMRGVGSRRVRRAAWLAALAAAAASFVFIASAAGSGKPTLRLADSKAVASPLAGGSGVEFEVTVGKECKTPMNVGDPLLCEFSISNTTQASHNSLTTDMLTDTVYAPDGVTVRDVHSIAINNS